MQRNDKKCDVIKISKRIVKTNQDIIGEVCIRIDNVVLTVSDEVMNKSSLEAFEHKVCMGQE